jgi:hypothetical protein
MTARDRRPGAETAAPASFESDPTRLGMGVAGGGTAGERAAVPVEVAVDGHAAAAGGHAATAGGHAEAAGGHAAAVGGHAAAADGHAAGGHAAGGHAAGGHAAAAGGHAAGHAATADGHAEVAGGHAAVVVAAAAERSEPIRVFSMKDHTEVQQRRSEEHRVPLHVQLRSLAEVSGRNDTPVGLGRLAPPRDPRQARARRWRDNVVWACVAIVLATVIAVVVWLIAGR